MKVVEVGAGLVFRGNRLLITQRPAGGHLAGLWEFPGGKREPNESFRACLERELKKELGNSAKFTFLFDFTFTDSHSSVWGRAYH